MSLLGAPGVKRRTTGWLLALASLAPSGAATQPLPLTLHYQQRAPYSQKLPDGRVVGLVATPAQEALERAGVAFRWALTPAQRQLALVESGRGQDCGLGWFRNTAREQRGKFTQALYRDRPFVALVRRDAALQDGTSVHAALARADLPLLIKEAYSYGADLDASIAAAARPPQRTGASNEEMASMLVAGRAAWTVMAPEEAQVLFERAPGVSAALRTVRLADMPEGQTRHLYCSRAVSDAVIERIDRALAATR